MKTLTSSRRTWGYVVTTRTGLEFDVVRGDYGTWHISVDDEDGMPETICTFDTKRECMEEIKTDEWNAVVDVTRMLRTIGTL